MDDNGKCLALMFHYVRDRSATAAGPTGLSVKQFTAQIERLTEQLVPIDWTRFHEWRSGHASIPERSFLLTFDDGLADHAEIVCPVLDSLGLKGIFFVSTRPLATGELEPTHQIHRLLAHLGVDRLDHEIRRWAAAQEPATRALFQSDTESALTVYDYESPAVARLKYLLGFVLPGEVRDRMIRQLHERHLGDTHQPASKWYLTWKQLRDMQQRGHTIGGHGHAHDPYGRQSVLIHADDMTCCEAILRERLGAAPRPFSYPFGSVNRDIARRCAYAGFVNGFTTRKQWISARSDAHRLGRVDTIHVDAFLEKEFACTAS